MMMQWSMVDTMETGEIEIEIEIEWRIKSIKDSDNKSRGVKGKSKIDRWCRIIMVKSIKDKDKSNLNNWMNSSNNDRNSNSNDKN